MDFIPQPGRLFIILVLDCLCEFLAQFADPAYQEFFLLYLWIFQQLVANMASTALDASEDRIQPVRKGFIALGTAKQSGTTELIKRQAAT